MALNPDVVEDVTATNFKTIAGFAASQANILLANAVSHNKAMDQAREVVFQAWAKRMGEIDPEEAISTAKELSSDLPEVLSQLGTAIAAIQQIVKTAQTTPPPTAA